MKVSRVSINCGLPGSRLKGIYHCFGLLDCGPRDVDQVLICFAHVFFGCVTFPTCAVGNPTGLVTGASPTVAEGFRCRWACPLHLLDAFDGAAKNPHAVCQQLAVPRIGDVVLHYRAIGAHFAPAGDFEFCGELVTRSLNATKVSGLMSKAQRLSVDDPAQS